MYIEPNTNIKILKNCPIDPDFTNSIWFSSVETQTTYFNTLVKYNLTNYTYQRVNKGIARVGIQAENLYDCNYMMFQNTAFGTKWFYAFIDKVEYINNNMSEIYFTIDPIQSWFFDYTLNQTFVAREHSVHDTFGENLLPESVELGEYTIQDVQQPLSWNTKEKVIVVASTEWYDNGVWKQNAGGKYGGIFSGVHFAIASGTNKETDTANYLEHFTNDGKTDAILGVWELYNYYTSAQGYSDEIQTGMLNSIHGYIPRNKKLLTFPYTFMESSTPDGNKHTFMYEYFADPEDITFNIRGVFNGTMSISLYARDYKGASPNYDEIISYNGAGVQCAYVTDSFKAWLAQNSYNLQIGGHDIQLPLKATNNLFGSAIGLAGGSAGAVASSSASAITSILEMYQKQGVTPNSGTLGSGATVNHVLGIDMFRVNLKAITRPFAERIDKYFDRYGYTTNAIKTPNTHSRPHWNYVQTVGCTINGSLPADDEQKICSIYDKGITFWKRGSEVGNYSLDNRP